MSASGLMRAERLTLSVLLCGVASLALSDFVSPFYWSLSVGAGLLRFWRGPHLALSEMQASLIGWAGFVWVGVELLLGRAWVVAFTDFLLILAFAVVIEAATPRNHLHRMLVGLFLVLAAAVLTDSVLFVVPLGFFLWFAWRSAAWLYTLNQPGGMAVPESGLRDAVRIAGMALCAGLLFLAMPRFDFHSLLKPVQPRMQTSGFSDQVRLGDFARELDPTVVLRIEPLEMESSRFRRLIRGRYWRGVSLEHFTGHGWQKGVNGIRRHWPKGSSVRIGVDPDFQAVVYREASDHPYLQLPDGFVGIEKLPEAVQQETDGSIRFVRAPSRRLRLRLMLQDAANALSDSRPPLPEDLDTSHTPAILRDWVRRSLGSHRSAAEDLHHLTALLQGWQYDLHARLDNQNPLGSFLQNRRGHCELFATTLALAARELGLPAHVVNGYYGGEWNDVGNFLLLRQQHAHSWVEIWLDGRWQRFDPTPVSRWALSGVWLPRLDQAWESLKLAWFRYVLEFQNEDRTAVWRAALRRIQSWRFVWPALTFILVLLWIGRWYRGRGRGSRTSSLHWRLMDLWLVRHGIHRHPDQPLSALPLPRHVEADRWRDFVQRWEWRHYGREQPWGLAQLCWQLIRL